MSLTSQCLEYGRLLRKAGHDRKAQDYIMKAAGYIGQDLLLPPHLVPGMVNRERLTLDCSRCHETVFIESLSKAADFRDLHWHCGEDRVTAWTCPCGCREFAWQETCRFCGTDRSEGGRFVTMLLAAVLHQRRRFDITIQAEPGVPRLTPAWVMCGSRLRALRAARAMFPGYNVEVHLL